MPGKLGRKIPVVDDVLASHEQDLCLTTSLNGNCVEFEFQTDLNYYVDLKWTYLALKLNFFNGCGYGTYNTKKVKIEHKKVARVDEETERGQEAPAPVVTHGIDILR